MELGLRIPIVSRIPDSGFLVLYSGFQSPGFWIPQLKFRGFRIPHPKNFPDSVIWGQVLKSKSCVNQARY